MQKGKIFFEQQRFSKAHLDAIEDMFVKYKLAKLFK
jgi:hypothetical protein